MAIMGGIIYGANDVLAEASLRNNGEPTEYLAMMGFFAAIVSFVQAFLFERKDVANFFHHIPEEDAQVCSVMSGFWILGAYVLSSVLSYIGGARFLLISEATFLNLSLLTSDLWSMIFSVIAEKIVPQPLFWVALSFIVGGVVVYEMAPPPKIRRDLSSEDFMDGIMKDTMAAGHLFSTDLGNISGSTCVDDIVTL